MLAGEPDLFTNERDLYLREVLEVLSGNIMRVRSSLLPPKHGEVGSTEVYLVGKYKDLKEYGSQLLNGTQKKYRKDSINHINTGKNAFFSDINYDSRDTKFIDI